MTPPHLMSLGLFKTQDSIPHIPSPSHCSASTSSFFPFETLAIDEHNRRSRRQSRVDFGLSSSNPPTPVRDSYAALYPLAPHLTPQHSPMGSPRAESPALSPPPPSSTPDIHAGLPTTHLLGKLSIRVVEAKGLAVRGPPHVDHVEKPYVLLQYDRTECVVPLLLLSAQLAWPRS